MATPMWRSLRRRSDFSGAQWLLEGVQELLVVRVVNELLRFSVRQLSPLRERMALTRRELEYMRRPNAHSLQTRNL